MKTSPVDLTTLIEQYKSGLSLSALTKIWRADIRTLQRRLRKAGVPLRTAGESRALVARAERAARKLPIEEMVRMYQEGSTLRDISERFHIHHRTAQPIMKAAGVYRNRSAAKARHMATLTPEQRREITAAALEARVIWAANGGYQKRRKPQRKNPPVRAGLQLV